MSNEFLVYEGFGNNEVVINAGSVGDYTPASEEKEIKLFNDLSYKLSQELIKAVYKVAHRLDADTIVINKAKYNWADIALYEDGNCIEEHYNINTR